MQWTLTPQSPDARHVALLWWFMLAIGGTIWIGVFVTAWVAVARKRADSPANRSASTFDTPDDGARRVVTVAAFATVAVLAAFLAFDFTVGRMLAEHPSRALTIDLTGHQWWWEVQYENPDASKTVVSANEIHIPTGEAVQIKLRAADVIHSFWVPQLNGKRDLIPGYLSNVWIRADTAGVYQGRCAEFCGLQHANMGIVIVAEGRPRFNAWLQAQTAAAASPTQAAEREGEHLFLAGPCATCHAVGGTTASGRIGPDLTHVASRATLGAGVLPNVPGALEAWLIDAPSIKPGVRMPAMTTYNGAQLRMIAAYLTTRR